MPSVSRLGLRAWLEEKLNSNAYSGVRWVDENEGLFSISWKHASKQGWIEDEDAAIFRDWAVHTGRYRDSIDAPNPKTWKANFRCAMNASRDIRNVLSEEYIKDKTIKVFEFTKNRKSSVTVSQRTSSVNLEQRKKKKIRAAAKVVARKRSSQLQRQASLNHKFVKCGHSLDEDVFENNGRDNGSSLTTIDIRSTCMFNNTMISSNNNNNNNNNNNSNNNNKNKTFNRQLPNIKNEDQDADNLSKQQNDELYKKDIFSLAEILEQVPPGLVSNQLNVSPNLFDVNNNDIKDLLEYVDPKDEPMSDSDYDSEPYQLPHYPSSPDSSDAEEIADMFDFISNNKSQFLHQLEDILVPDFNESAFLEKQQRDNLPPLSSINAPFFPALMNFKNDPFIGCHSNRFDVVKALKASLFTGCQ